MPIGVTLLGGGGGGAAGWLAKVSNEAARLALSPTAGDVVVQSDDGTWWYYNGANWELRSHVDPILEVADSNSINLTKLQADPPYDDDTPDHLVKLQADLVLSGEGPDASNTLVDNEIRATGLHSQMPYATNVADGSMSAEHVVDLETVIQGLAAHLADAIDAHDASAISYDPTAPTNELVSTEVQAALTELDTRTNTQATPQFQDVQVLGTGLGNRFLGRTLALASSTGLVSGGVLSVGAPTSTFSITAGAGEVVDVTNPAAPVVTPVTWAAFTNIAVTFLATHPISYILINSAGAVVQQTTFPTPVERRQMIFLGRLNHFNNIAVTFADTFPDYKLSPIAAFYDLLDAMAPFKADDGLVPTANGANLSVNLSAGKVFFRSANYATTILNPNIITFTGGTPQAFRKMTRSTTVDVADVTVVDPTQYDNAGVLTVIGGGANTSTVQRIFAYKSGAIRIQYGQTTYATLAAARSAATTETFVPNPTIEQTAILVGYLCLTRTATTLNDPNQASFLPAARFGAVSSGGGGTTTLQQAYFNSVQPQIILEALQAGIQIRDNATPLGVSLWAVQNNGGTTSYLDVSAAATNVTNLVGSGTTGAIRLHNLTTTQRNALTPAVGMIIYNTTLEREEAYNGAAWEPTTGTNVLAAATIANAATYTFTKGRDQTVQLASTTTNSTISLDHTALSEGSIVRFVGTNDAATITLVSAAGLSLNGSWTGGADDMLTLLKIGTVLKEVSRSE